MSLKNFFQKDFKIKPSGKIPHERGRKVSKYARPLVRALKGSLGAAAMAVLASACSSPSYSETDALKKTIPERERKEMILSYDQALIGKIDSLRLDEGLAMTDAVSKALNEMEKQTFSPDTARWTAKDYVLSDHAQKRRNEAFEPVNLFGWKARHVNEDFREDLRESIFKQESKLNYETVSVKAVGKARHVR